MKISSLEEYGLRCLIQLAKSDQESLMSAEEISKKEGLSIAYTEKILQKLSKAGFIKSIRGAKGGYALAETADQIMIGNVIRAIDGSFFAELCNHFSGNISECTHLSGCGIRPLWTNIYKYIFDVLDKTSLQDLLKEEDITALVLEERFQLSLEQLAGV